MNRRTFLKQLFPVMAISVISAPVLSACTGMSAVVPPLSGGSDAVAEGEAPQIAMHGGEGAPGVTPVEKSLEEWRQLLPGAAYSVLFEEATEPPFSSPLLNEHRAGAFLCAACNLPLFSSTTKFESGTGWPSFYEALPNSVGTREDSSFMMVRTEYHCVRCGGHQGHLFNDGPAPTGMRYCNNGLAIQFIPEGESLPALRS